MGGHAEGDVLFNIENLTGSNGFSDKLIGNDADNLLRGNGGDDTLRGEDGGDRLIGGAGSDWATYATSDAAVTVDLATGTGTGGHAAGDVLSGNDGGNTLRGNGGNDMLNGGQGDDVLLGGAGNDRFVFDANWGDDTITDFRVSGSEVLDFSSLGISQANLTIAYGPSNTTITFAGNEIVLVGSTATLQNADFDF